MSMRADRGRPIGYYVHHQGRGHLARALAIRARLARPCTLIGTFAGEESAAILCLPDDRRVGDFSGRDGEPSRPEAFHYAPVDAVHVRERMAILAAWIASANPACLVVDVSCEVALFARLLSVPVVLVRLAGRRIDTPHLEAFRAADILIAPFPAEFDHPDTPAWVREKTAYAGFICDPRERSGAPCTSRRVALVSGRGGSPLSTESIAAAAQATPTWDWHVFGLLEVLRCPPENLHLHGWCEHLAPHLSKSPIVVGGCGDGLLAEVAAQGLRFVCLPEDRPFDEQRSKARVLAACEMALVLDSWPTPDRWEAILAKASALDPGRLGALHDPSAADTAARVIEAVIANRT